MKYVKSLPQLHFCLFSYYMIFQKKNFYKKMSLNPPPPPNLKKTLRKSPALNALTSKFFKSYKID